MRYSKQRELILQTLKQNHTHPTVEELYALVQAKDSQIGLATVYRNVGILAEEGLIKKIVGLDNKAHFDCDTHKHYHFICSKCKKVYDIPQSIAPHLAQNVFETSGMIVENTEITLSGICKDCQDKLK